MNQKGQKKTSEKNLGPGEGEPPRPKQKGKPGTRQWLPQRVVFVKSRKRPTKEGGGERIAFKNNNQPMRQL